MQEKMMFDAIKKNRNVKDETLEITEEPTSIKFLMLRTLNDGKVIYNEVHIDVVYEIAPLEAIKKNFLKDAKEKILSDISNLSADAKKTLKYLEQKKAGVKTTEIVTKGFLLVSGGGNQDRINKSIKELDVIFVARKDAGGTSFGRLKDRIKELLGNFEATEQEIENVYNHILMEML